MSDIKIRELPSKFKEIKKEKSDEDEENEQESLEEIIQQLRARAVPRQAMMARRPAQAVSPVLKTNNIAQVVSGPQAPVVRKANETEKDFRPVVYESREKNKYDSSSSSEKKYESPNAERKYLNSPGSETKRPEESRRVSPVLGDAGISASSRGIFGSAQEQRGVQFSNNQDNRRDYEVNPLAEESDRKRSRRL